ncbi:hypothetical protein CRYUN_Cryun33cG0016300 [Craigia yunnanensis]
MASMYEDDSPELTEMARILKDVLEIPDVPLKTRKLVVKTTGRDGSGGITGGRSRSNIKMRRTVVAVEGSLYTQYTMLREYVGPHCIWHQKFYNCKDMMRRAWP